MCKKFDSQLFLRRCARKSDFSDSLASFRRRNAFEIVIRLSETLLQ